MAHSREQTEPHGKTTIAAASLVEYALLIALIAVSCISALTCPR